MKVKKLEWDNSPHYLKAKDNEKQIEYIIERVCVYKDCCNNKNRYISYARHTIDIDKSNDLKEIKKSCQDHYEAFILSHIENDHIMVEHDMAFDPTLLGFIESEPNKLYRLATKIYCLGDFDLLPIKGKWFLHNPKKGWLFRGIKIPSHDFGVTLISQFLGVE